MLFRGERRLLLRVCALVMVNRVTALGPAAASKIVIDQVVGAHRPELVPPLALGLVVAVAVEAATGFALYRSIGVASQRAITRLRTSLHAHVLDLPAGFFDGARSGGLLSRLMADPDVVRDVFGPGLVQLASGVLTAVLAVSLLLALDWTLTAAVTAILLASLVALSLGLARLYRAFHVTSELTAELTGRLAEVLGGIRVVKTFGAERREAHAFTRESHRLLRAFARAFGGVGGVLAVSALATGLVNAAVLVLGGRAVLAGSLTLGDLVLYVFLVGLLSVPLLQIAAHMSELGQAAAALSRIAQLKAVATEDDHDRGLTSLAAVAGAVAFDRVSFAFRPSRWALRDVSFEAPAGTTVAIVGLNGSGKTTTMRLLGGLARPTAGRMLVDGRDLAAVRLRAWRKHVAAVLQEPFLFDGSIAENIAYGRARASPAEIRRVGRLAHCEEFVGGLPDGYATRVGERGVQLSGGQRQRVAIARALLADPRVLLLDEATAHLDPASEALVQDGLRALRAGRTTFVIAHRLATVRDADQILVLESGALVERGTHAELITRRGYYWRLAAGQVPPEPWRAEGVA
jgi:ABC-type multidrug transport system fused ATPase/permease subunit